MALTLAALLHRAELGLQLRHGDPRLEITWVHISDLADPTPYLQPGCMLLTTGLSLGESPREWSEYVAGLLRVAVPALGFGVGLRHRRIPKALLAAATEQNLALVEVPERTRFSELIHAAVEIGSREDRAQHALVLERHRELLKAALTAPAHRSLVNRLQDQLNGWVVLLSHDRQVLATAPASARHRADRVRAELRRATKATVVRFDIDGQQVIVLPVGGPRVTGWLAIGRDDPLAATERSVADATVSLLQLDIARAAELLDAERRERRAVLDLLLSGQRSDAVRVADRLGVAVPDGRVRLAMLRSGTSGDLLEALEASRELQLASALVATADDAAIVVVSAQRPDYPALLTSIVDSVPGSRGVVLDVADPADLPRAVRRLTRALITVAEGRLVEVGDDRAASLAGQLDQESGQVWAEELIAPLRSADSRVDLLETVRAYLAHNGSAERTAGALAIHRRTLGYRLGRAEQALGRSLADPTTRAELWIALQLGPKT